MIQQQKHDYHEELDAMGDALSRGRSQADCDNTIVSDLVESQFTEAVVVEDSESDEASDNATNALDQTTNDK